MKKIILALLLILFTGGCTMNPSQKALDGQSERLAGTPTEINASKTVSADQVSPPANVAETTSGPQQPTPEPDDGYFIQMGGDRPFGLAFDNQGRMLVVKAPPTGDGTLLRVEPDGKTSEVAALKGTFIGPGIDTDTEGNCYITVGDKLLKIQADGVVSTLADGFSKCMDVKRDDRGYLYVADDGKDAIYEIGPDKEKTLVYQGEASGSFILTCLAFDKEFEHLYAAEKGSILRFSRDAEGRFGKPEVVAEDIRKLFFIGLDDRNRIYVDNTESLFRLGEDGKLDPLAEALLIPLSFKFGGKGFDASSVYIAVGDGIYRIKCLE